jgi:hypothetical protein
MDITDEYIAGFFDGEGCVSLMKHRSPSTKSHYIYNTIVIITNSNLQVLRDIRTKLGLGILNEKPISTRNKAVYSIAIRRQEEIKTFLNRFLPLLRVKKAEATLLLEYINRRLSFEGDYRRFPYIERDEEIYRELKTIKGFRSHSKAKVNPSKKYSWQTENI